MIRGEIERKMCVWVKRISVGVTRCFHGHNRVECSFFFSKRELFHRSSRVNHLLLIGIIIGCGNCENLLKLFPADCSK